MRTSERTKLGGAERDALAVGAAVAVFGLSYGVVAVAAGVPPLLACLSSALVFAGGSQFAFVGVLAAGGTPLLAASSGLLLNARYLPFGFAVAPRVGAGPWWQRLLVGYAVTDESVALALAARGADEVRRRYWVAAAAVFVGWNVGTAVGAYGGALLGDPATFGLDAALPAGFVALLAGQVRDRRLLAVALVGAAIAVATLPFVPPGLPIVLAGLAALPAVRSG